VRPSLVLLDLMMPVMDGVQFRAAQLRDPQIAQVPVVCISAIDDAEQRDGQLRAAAYITKPFDMDQITAVVRAQCRARPE
jgi:DNA-binding response OmpR family regulator